MKPVPFSIARAGARSAPSVSAALWRLAGSEGRSYGLSAHVGPAPVGEIVSGRTCSCGKARAKLGGARIGLAVARPDHHRRTGSGECGAERARGKLPANRAEKRRARRRDTARAAGPRAPPRRGRRSCPRALRRGAPHVRRRTPRRRAGRCRAARPATRPSRPCARGSTAIGVAGVVSAIRAIRVPQVRQTPPVSAAARLSPWPSSSIPSASSSSAVGSSFPTIAAATSPSATTAALEPSPRACGIRSVKRKLQPAAGTRRSKARTPRCVAVGGARRPGMSSSSFQRSSAAPAQSKPGPMFAVVAGARTRMAALRLRRCP